MNGTREPVVDALVDRGRESPRAPAVVWDDDGWSYGELVRRMGTRLSDLRNEGVERGDVVAVEALGTPDAVLTLMACWALGAVPAPVHARATDAERTYHDLLLRPAWRGDADGGVTALRPREASLDTRIDPTPAVLVTTSGSSGRPRGIALSHDGLVASARATARRLELAPDDVWGLALSPAHAGGIATVARTMVTGSSLRLWPSARDTGRLYDPPELIADILEGRTTHVSLVPAMVAGLLDGGLAKPAAAFRCALVGGAHMPRSLLERAGALGVPVALTWGMTETTGQVATATAQEVAASGSRTVGRPLPGIEVRVEADGRLAVRGPTLAAGQVDAPGAPLAPLAVDAGGWLRTGDLGHLDDEGRVVVAGRADEMIITGGVNVSPREVEDVLLQAAGVAEAVVWGVEDARWGQVVCAAAVPAPGHTPPLSVEALHRHCRAHLTRSRCPTHIVLVPRIPRTPTGKPALTRLHDLLSPTSE